MSIELREFDINYKPRGAVKRQAMVDFVVELTPSTRQGAPKLSPHPRGNGSSTNHASRAGLIIITPKETKLEYVVQFRFKATNNKAKYEALVEGLKIT